VTRVAIFGDSTRVTLRNDGDSTQVTLIFEFFGVPARSFLGDDLVGG